jgi:hypothetical protein
MKRMFFLVIPLFIAPGLYAQSIVDALRYSSESLHGTARYSSMSGAFGALGGDLSAVQINPASSAVFLNNTASVSLSLLDKKNEANYFNTFNTTYNSDIGFNQAGLVFVFNNNNTESNWRKFTLGFNFNVTNNFDDAYFASGQSNSSIDAYFLGYAQGVPLNLLQLQSGESISGLYRFLGENQGFGAQQAFLGFQSFIIDPVDFDDPDNVSYVSNVASGLKNQEYSKQTSGYNAKFSINLGTQIRDNLYLGINLNSHIIDYRESTFFYESNSNSASFINQIGFRNNLAVTGDGFSAQIGLISRATDYFRFGLTFDTPTWYSILEETTQRITTVRTENSQSITERIQPNIINVYEQYTLRTPGKLTGSIAYLFGADGLISVDYSYKDYSNIQFRPTSIPAFSQENNRIENTLKGASTIKVGGEYRINQLSLRGGFKFEESPYQNQELMSDLSGFSLGFGYNFGSIKVDLAYARTEQDRLEQFFPNSAFSNASSIRTAENFITLTTNFVF